MGAAHHQDPAIHRHAASVAPFDPTAAERCRATPNCPGLILDGYCAVCGKSGGAAAGAGGAGGVASPPADRRTESSHGSQPSGSRSSPTHGTTGPTTTQHAATRWRAGDTLVELPYIPSVDPTAAVMRMPIVPEEKRYCAGCAVEVGRSRNGRPARVTGFCSKCRTPYAFVPMLAADELLADQYRVLGCLAYGGLGWIYLAQDERVSNRWVVLKGVLNAGDPGAMAAALAERQFLARVEHPNVVRIYNVVEHSGGGYIVMEYVGGRTLKSVVRERRQEGMGPLPVDLAIAYILAVLPAFGYLHELGLVYNDFKPDNVMLQGGDVKLIDLGAVTRLGEPDPVIYGTDGYQAPEMGSQGPSVASDLYSVARCLAVLVLDLPSYQGTHRHRLPARDEEPLFEGNESLYRFLQKATAHDPRDRYQSAPEMAEALDGILREVTAVSQGHPRPAPSRLFGGTALSNRWESTAADSGPSWRHLPPPRVDTTDPAASAVLDSLMLEPAQQVSVLRDAVARGLAEPTAEVQLAIAGALIELGRHAEAEAGLGRLEEANRREWRGNWYRGLSLLAQGMPAQAALAFDLVYSELPGELAPKLALAVADELAHHLERAAQRYDVVSTTDPGLTAASFGLARTRLAQADLSGALEAYERIPPTSSLHSQAQLALARALIRGGSSGPPVDDLVRASSIIERLPLTDQQQAELAVVLFEAALTLLAASGPSRAPDTQLLGRPLREIPVRFALERAYRDLAWIAVGVEKIHLVEAANEVRPMTGV